MSFVGFMCTVAGVLTTAESLLSLFYRITR